MSAYTVARAALFRIGGGDAEAAHEWTLRRLAGLPAPALALLRQRYAVRAPVRVFGVDFPNPVGLAAGMDKNGVALRAWPALGFGFVEVGTVTARAQPGNPRPRLFRLPASEAVINRMGFNNEGAAALAARLAAGPAVPGLSDAPTRSARGGREGAAFRPPIGVPLGISLGKSKVTPLDEAVADYVTSYEAVREHAAYIAVNVSSPNTPGLRALQDRDHLDALLSALVGGPPVLVKMAPDLTEQAIAEVLQVCTDRGAAGVIATNTTLSREGVPESAPHRDEAGGLSGRPLTARAREVVAFVHRETAGALPVIGVGGILDPDDAARLFDAGAALVQLYTGFIYRGPALVRAIARAAAARDAVRASR